MWFGNTVLCVYGLIELLLFRKVLVVTASRKCLIVVMVLAFAGVILSFNGCGKSGKLATAKEEKTPNESVKLCTSCGQIKGSPLCCKPNQPKSSSCSLAKGSPSCGKTPKDATSATICTKCGQIKGSELCCKPNQTKCTKCGLVKGSPGCCKISKK